MAQIKSYHRRDQMTSRTSRLFPLRRTQTSPRAPSSPSAAPSLPLPVSPSGQCAVLATPPPYSDWNTPARHTPLSAPSTRAIHPKTALKRRVRGCKRVSPPIRRRTQHDSRSTKHGGPFMMDNLQSADPGAQDASWGEPAVRAVAAPGRTD